jgi:hypothetical protein
MGNATERVNRPANFRDLEGELLKQPRNEVGFSS